MKILRTFGVAFLVSSAFLGPYGLAQAQAQSSQQAASMPPALRAAVESGNKDIVIQAINTLSGGNAAAQGELAALVAQAAEQMVESNPQGALSGMEAALSFASLPAVQQASPSSAMDIASRSSAIVSNSAVWAANPERVSAATSTMVKVVSNPVVFQTDPNTGTAVARVSVAVANELPAENSSQSQAIRQSVTAMKNDQQLVDMSSALGNVNTDPPVEQQEGQGEAQRPRNNQRPPSPEVPVVEPNSEAQNLGSPASPS